MSLSQICNKILLCLKLISLIPIIHSCDNNNQITEIENGIFISQANTKKLKKPLAVKLSYQFWASESTHEPELLFNDRQIKNNTFIKIDSADHSIFHFNKLIDPLQEIILRIDKNDTTQAYFKKENLTLNQVKISMENTESFYYQLTVHQFIYPIEISKSDTLNFVKIPNKFKYEIRKNLNDTNRLNIGDFIKADIIQSTIQNKILYDSRMSQENVELKLNSDLMEVYRLPLLKATREDTIDIRLNKKYIEESMVIFGTNYFNDVHSIYIILK